MNVANKSLGRRQWEQARYFPPFTLRKTAVTQEVVGRTSSGARGMACGLDGRGSNPGRGKRYLFLTVSRQALGLTHPPIQLVPEGKAARA
jgi:hypothetical protein